MGTNFDTMCIEGCPLSFWKALICKGFPYYFNETRLWGDVKLSPQSLVLFFVTILFNEKSEPWPFFGQVWPILNFSDRCFLSFIHSFFIRRIKLSTPVISNRGRQVSRNMEMLDAISNALISASLPAIMIRTVEPKLLLTMWQKEAG